MKILAIDTSCDETAVAVTEGLKVIAHNTYSHILLHEKWGGVVPNLSKRAHEENIDDVIQKVLKSSKTSVEKIDAVAVTFGPGLAIALGVGIQKAKELSSRFDKPLIAVNHMEGHIYSCFVQNSKGNPKRDFNFPYIALLVSGGHTELVLFKDHCSYSIIGETLDDAAGEAIDKAARLIMGRYVYPGGPLLERLAAKGDSKFLKLPRPMIRSNDLNFSYSGLKTSLFYTLKKHDDEWRNEHMHDLAASYQEAVCESLIFKLQKAMKQYDINRIIVGGGVSVNKYFRKKIRQIVKLEKGTVIFPPYTYLNGDNAAMIGIAAYFKAQKGMFVNDLSKLDRMPRARVDQTVEM